MKILTILTITMIFSQLGILSTDYKIESLYGKWYAKKILVNGKEDPKNFPVNNDELTLNKDMTVVSIDKTYDLIDKGTWKFIKPNKLVIKNEEGSMTFVILKLTEEELHTKMDTDEINMVIEYNRKK